MIRDQIVDIAKTFIGTSYKVLDCNELVRHTFRKLGVELGDPSSGNAKDLYNKGLTKDISKATTKAEVAALLNKGDLVFWGNPKYPTRWREIHHVAIYIGDGKIIESTGDPGVHIGNLWESSGVTGWQIVLIADITPLLQEEETMLNKNSAPELIAEFQQELIDVGESLPKYGVDGKWGSETDAAIKSFKTSHGLPADTIVNEYVHHAIAKEYRALVNAFELTVENDKAAFADIIERAQGRVVK